jgi:hypothetical protein
LRRIILQALAPHRLSVSVITPGMPLSFSMSPGAQQALVAGAAAGSITRGMGSKTTSLAVSASYGSCVDPRVFKYLHRPVPVLSTLCTGQYLHRPVPVLSTLCTRPCNAPCTESDAS